MLTTSWLALPLALLLAPLAYGLPVARSEALLDVQRGQTDVGNLIHAMSGPDASVAEIAYATVQSRLEGLGLYLGQLKKCVSSEAAPHNRHSIPSKDSAIKALRKLESKLHSVASGITHKDQSASVAAWEAAQESLDSTHPYVFRRTSETVPSVSTIAAIGLYEYIQALQATLQTLAGDIARDDFTSAQRDYKLAFVQLDTRIATVLSCKPFAGKPKKSVSTSTTAILAVNNVMLALQKVAEETLTGVSSTKDCELAGGHLLSTSDYIWQKS